MKVKIIVIATVVSAAALGVVGIYAKSRLQGSKVQLKYSIDVEKRLAAQGNLEFRMADDVAPLTTRVAKTLKGNSRVTRKTDEYDGLKRGKIKYTGELHRTPQCPPAICT